jgi:diguanylate cyclase (GGDEF)-like protein/PAS domain S-box-containing protein
MKLARIIQTEMEHFLEDWEETTVQITPELKGHDSRALRDYARAMLELVTKDLLTSQTKQESARKALGKATLPTSITPVKRDSGGLKQGISMLQMIQELRALRERVIMGWGEEQQGLTTQDIDELLYFIEAVDELIANSVSSYSSPQHQEIRLLEAMLQASPDPSAIFDPDGKLLFLNTAMADLASVQPRDAIGKTTLELELGLGFAVELHEAIVKTVTTGQFQRREFYCRLPSGRDVYFDSQLVPVFDDRNEVQAVTKTLRDITERKQVEYQVWRSANFDSLTGIPNRRLFLDRLQQALLEAKRKYSSLALLFIDLDRFKQTNDQLGHEAGDQLLGQVAQRISTNIRAMDTVARLGGDEFTVILKDTSGEGAKKAAKALLANLEEGFDVDSHRVHLSGSIGVTLFPNDGMDADQLMHNADQAMYTAKQHGGQQIQLYESWMAQSESEHMQLNRELDAALRENQLEVYYQPIIDIRTGAISRAEALLRWNHPDKGLLTPAAFLTIAEQSGLSARINGYVLEQAVTCSLRWRNQKHDTFPININESPASFFTRTLMEQWGARLTESDIDESRITIELAPASLTNIHASGLNPFKSFGLAGLRLHLAIDNFGIEPFSLFALQEFHVDSIKVNRELIKDAGQGGDADRIIKAIISMAHTINIRVVAEGVEKDEQFQFLSRAGCDYAQGFLFSKPLCQDDFEALLRRDSQYKPS